MGAVMTPQEQIDFDNLYAEAKAFHHLLAVGWKGLRDGVDDLDEDLAVIEARLANWLYENEGRWTR